jgi:hypothetical protein
MNAGDLLIPEEPASHMAEIRRYGPLSAVLIPGKGRAVYAIELRKAATPPKKANGKPAGASSERATEDIERRARYPLNIIAIPLSIQGGAEELTKALAEAWLEWRAASRPKAVKDFITEMKEVIPGIFDWPEDQGPTPANHTRKTLAALLARFAEWMKEIEASASVPNAVTVKAENVAEQSHDIQEDRRLAFWEPFKEWLLKRTTLPILLPPLRLRTSVGLFQGYTPSMRQKALPRRLGARHILDRQVFALATLRKNWDAAASSLKWLSERQRTNSTLLKALSDRHKTDLYGDNDRKITAAIRRVIEQDAELSSAMKTMETQLSVELESARSKDSAMGKRFDYAEESVGALQRLSLALDLKRAEVDKHIDLYEVGLSYAAAGNYEAASVTLANCLDRAWETPEPPQNWEGVGEEWFEERGCSASSFTKRPMPGEPESAGLGSMEFFYCNLGMIFMKMERWFEAAMCLKLFSERAAKRGWRFYGELARKMYEKSSQKVRENGNKR